MRNVDIYLYSKAHFATVDLVLMFGEISKSFKNHQTMH